MKFDVSLEVLVGVLTGAVTALLSLHALSREERNRQINEKAMLEARLSTIEANQHHLSDCLERVDRGIQETNNRTDEILRMLAEVKR